MCKICGCGDEHHVHDHDHDHTRDLRRIAIEADLLAKNDRLAGELRTRLAHAQITAINLIGAPGAGKTALLEGTIPALPGIDLSVIEGDQATDHDARRIAKTGCTVFQVNTGPGCHLDAAMVGHAFDHLAVPHGSLVFIENVGNLVCPALFDVGERVKVVVMSITEGEDKPLKYPHAFRAADALVLTKMDLLPHVDVDLDRLIDYARRINPGLAVFSIAARRGDGLGEWCGWVRAQAGRGP